MLAELGHSVSGIAFDPIPNSHFEVANVAKIMRNDIRQDVLNFRELMDSVERVSPDVVIHMAAQPLVRLSYKEPRLTFETNIMGTLNLLQSITHSEAIKAAVMVTTDKVYRNTGQLEGYVEEDALGGNDPYSASKSAADILAQSWVTSFDGPPTAVARAGNVIGGGDVCEDRLIVDLIAGFSSGTRPALRNPNAVRPWQHVLDCVNGYLQLSNALIRGNGQGEWNFGPDPGSFVRVAEVASKAASLWGGNASWQQAEGQSVHEEQTLTLDSRKANHSLSWKNLLPYPESLEWTVGWYSARHAGKDPEHLSRIQVQKFLELLDSPTIDYGPQFG